MNTELFAKIHEVITVEPQKFDMNSWENENVCGTTRCIAGHAIHLKTGQPLYSRDGSPHQSVDDLARSLGIRVDEESNGDFEYIATKLLDLNPSRAGGLFYTDDERARQFVHLAALGYDAEALSLLDL